MNIGSLGHSASHVTVTLSNNIYIGFFVKPISMVRPIIKHNRGEGSYKHGAYHGCLNYIMEAK